MLSVSLNTFREVFYFTYWLISCLTLHFFKMYNIIACSRMEFFLQHSGLSPCHSFLH